MRMTTDALVIRVTDTGESDRLVTLLTSEYGVLRAFANRAKKINGKLQGATQSLCYGDFSVYQSRDSYIIDEAVAKEVFFGLRQDIEKLALAQYFCSLAGELVPEMEPSEEILRVMLNSLHLLEKDRRSKNFLKAVTEFKLLSLSGFMPETTCPHCGNEPTEDIFFNPEAGCICCRESGRGGYKISPGVYAAIKHIALNPVDRIYSFSLPEEEIRKLAFVSEKFLLAQTKRNFKALDFYKSLSESKV